MFSSYLQNAIPQLTDLLCKPAPDSLKKTELMHDYTQGKLSERMFMSVEDPWYQDDCSLIREIYI